MRLPDWLTGSVFLVLGLVVLWHVQSFPEIPGQEYGAAVFPGLAAVGLAAAALILVALDLRRRRAGQGARARATGALIPDAELATAAADDEPSLRGRRLLALVLSVASIVFYALAAPSLGFILTSSLLLAVLMLAFGTRPSLIVPVAVVATLLIHTAFYKLLKVPLPWGLLQSVAW